MMAEWGPLGIKVAVLLVTGVSWQPATTDDVLLFKQAYGLESVAVVADPDGSLMGGLSGTPQEDVVDPRTMTIVHQAVEYPTNDHPELVALAQQNAP